MKDTVRTSAVRYRYIDTVVKIDSQVSIVQYHCDSLNRVIMDSLWMPGTHHDRQTSIRSMGAGKFVFKCHEDSLRLRITAQDSLLYTLYRDIERSTEYVEPIKPTFIERIKNGLALILSHLFAGLIAIVLYIILKKTQFG